MGQAAPQPGGTGIADEGRTGRGVEGPGATGGTSAAPGWGAADAGVAAGSGTVAASGGVGGSGVVADSGPTSVDGPARGGGAGLAAASRRAIGADEADAAARTHWEAEADSYQAEHGAFLAGSHRAGGGGGTADGAFVWGPEGLTEGEAGLLGPVDALVGRRVLEVGCGAAQCSRWLAVRGVQAVGVDIAVNQLRHAARLLPVAAGAAGNAASGVRAGRPVLDGGVFPPPGQPEPTTLTTPDRRGAANPPADAGPTRDGGAPDGHHGCVPHDRRHGGSLRVVAATATALPFPDAIFHLAFASYGAVQFVADLARLLAEVRRVLVPGGRWVFSVTHPVRWAFPDDPGPDGLTATGSYFDRTPYVETTGSSVAVYAEFHRTVGDYVNALVAGGFTIESIAEPQWPEWNHAEWGGWSPLRGTHLPGTLIIGCRAGA
jgi:SAM-dependent methyltransferase